MNILKKLFPPKQTPIETTLTITSKNGFHLRPIAEFANKTKAFQSTITIIGKNQEVSATQVPKILALALEKDESFILKCIGNDAQQANEYLTNFFEQLMHDDLEVKMVEQEADHYEAKALHGTTIAKGIAIGTVIEYFKTVKHSSEAPCTFDEALNLTAQDLDQLYKENQTNQEAQIFLAQKALLDSDLFQKHFDQIDEEIQKLKGTPFESRIADYQDLQKRIHSHMGINSEFKLPADVDTIIIANELLPSEVEELSKLSRIKGVILRQGSSTSHAAILLRAFKIPTLICHEKIIASGEYYSSILDTISGQFINLPTQSDFEKAKQKAHQFKTEQKTSYTKRFEPTITKDGKSINVFANITDINSAKKAKEQGADGVGLLRTEFLFTEIKPTLEQQTQAYQSILELFDDVTIRTLDIGGDKSLPYIHIEKEDNPFLGIRGIRFSLQEQTLFREQLLAVGLASANIPNKKIKIMFPMVSTPEEFTQAKNITLEVAKEHNLSVENIQFGIMLEVPSVIFALPEFDALVDFYSIGTNDLTQYLFAIERTHPTLSIDPVSPILLTALKQIMTTAKKPISICGELAGIESVTQTLIEMGYTTLSVSANLIPSLKERIRHV
ncbi:MAG: HPr family phosphocarrier protein [Campylobacterales bacterium]|nr:HPr family phosphocarrier protein [Campylobacterales bacterium]